MKRLWIWVKRVVVSLAMFWGRAVLRVRILFDLIFFFWLGVGGGVGFGGQVTVGGRRYCERQRAKLAMVMVVGGGEGRERGGSTSFCSEL